MRLSHIMKIYLPVLTLIAWSTWAALFGKESLSTILWLLAMAVSLFVHIQEERFHGR